MGINISNYEVYIIDYLDNKLSTLQAAELLLFLENNPGLKDEFEDLKALTVTPSPKDIYGFNESLKQPADCDAINLSVNNYTHYFVAALEGDLSPDGYNGLNSFLEVHPELVSEYNLYKACKVKPEMKISFPEPNKLKVRGKQVFLKYYMATAIAASLLLLFSVYVRLTPESNDAINSALERSIELQGDNTEKNPVKKINETKKTESDIADEAKEKKAIKTPAKITEKKDRTELKGESEIMAPLQKIEKKGMIINNTPLVSENKRTFYSDLYDDIKLSQELAFAPEEEEPVIRQPEQNMRNVKAGRILSSVFNTSEQLADQLPQSMNGWLVADLGIKGFNLLTNNNYSIERKFKANGNIEEVQVRDANRYK